MIIFEYNKINSQPVIRVTSSLENHFVVIHGSDDEPANELILSSVEGLTFDEIDVNISVFSNNPPETCPTCGRPLEDEE